MKSGFQSDLDTKTIKHSFPLDIFGLSYPQVGGHDTVMKQVYQCVLRKGSRNQAPAQI